MIVALIGFSVRSDLAGVTSFVRAGFIHQTYYRTLLHLFHSPALVLDRLLPLWVRLALIYYIRKSSHGATIRM
jgi:hypothetical protein